MGEGEEERKKRFENGKRIQFKIQRLEKLSKILKQSQRLADRKLLFSNVKRRRVERVRLRKSDRVTWTTASDVVKIGKFRVFFQTSGKIKRKRELERHSANEQPNALRAEASGQQTRNYETARDFGTFGKLFYFLLTRIFPFSFVIQVWGK